MSDPILWLWLPDPADAVAPDPAIAPACGGFPCRSYAHHLSTEITRDRSAPDPRNPGRSRHDDFVLMRTLDAASPRLAQAAASGLRLAWVMIELRRPQPKAPDVPWFRWLLEDVILTAYTTSLEDDAPLETLSLSYGSLAWTFVGPRDADLPDTPTSTAWRVFG